MADQRREPVDASHELALLTREVDLRVLDVSVSGCLLETHRAVEVGTLATVRVTIGDQAYSDDAHVVRCYPIVGGSTFHVGTKFLWTSPPHRHSLRRIADGDVVDAEGIERQDVEPSTRCEQKADPVLSV